MMKNFLPLAFSFLLSLSSFAEVPSHFSGLDLEKNQPLDLSIDKNKKATVLLFLSAKCPCSYSHEALLRDLARDFSTVQFIAIHSNQDEPLDQTKKHFQDSKLPFPVLQDAQAKIADALHAFKTPHSYVLNAKGEILYEGGVTDSHVGPAAKSAFLREALNDIVAGRKPSREKTRSLGCVISRK